MKTTIITNIEQAMLKRLDNAQLEVLHAVLEQTLKDVTITASAENTEKTTNADILSDFISAKKLEGCSDKSLKYYETKTKLSLQDINAKINELMKQSLKSDGVINLFTDAKEGFSLFDPKFLEEISKMKEKNIAVELLKKLIEEQISVYRRTNAVKSEKFSELMRSRVKMYLNGMITNEEVIAEMLKLAKEIQEANKDGEKLGLTSDELAFYDALTKPQAIKDFYQNEELIAITKELTDTLRRNKTIDWQKKDSARARMRMMIKKLLKTHRYPPDEQPEAIEAVMTQCELWADNYV